MERPYRVAGTPQKYCDVDPLQGGAYDDHLVGGAAGDQLMGYGGNDAITDFQVRVDKLRLEDEVYDALGAVLLVTTLQGAPSLLPTDIIVV
jgi:hypothetical protein